MTEPKLPRGWHSSPSEAFGFKTPMDRPVACGNCDWEGIEPELGREMADLDRLWDRLSPGSEVPVGECPECFSLAYYTDILVAYKRRPGVLDMIVEATE